MTLTVSPAFLCDVARGTPVAAELWDGITEQQLADWEGAWVPELFRVLQSMRLAGVERQHWPQSRHWDWRKRTPLSQKEISHES